MRRVAVIGSGISGLASAWLLDGQARVTLFEADTHFGGHTHTVDLTLNGVSHGVDTGFLVFNHRTYPQLVRLFQQLKIDTAESDMSFSVQVPASGLEWSGSNLNTVFAQRGNLLRPRFLFLLREILRFNKLTTELVNGDSAEEGNADEDVESFLRRHRFGATFREWYLLPMVGCIWSCPTEQMLKFPIATLIRFCHNHGLIQVNNRPQWHTVRGGARHYVDAMLRRIPDARLNTPVRSVRRQPSSSATPGVTITTDAGHEWFDEVVFACHSDQALALLADATELERQVLGAIRYHPNRAVLHTDTSLLPRRPLAWAAWNCERAANAQDERSGVCLHYLINRLQPLPWATPVVVSLNPLREPKAATVHGEWNYSHPVFDRAAIAAQAQVPAMQGHRRAWFAGAWTRYGFHEDGLMSAQAVVAGMLAAWAQEPGTSMASNRAMPEAA
jgi:uncharacterized protein